MKIIFMLLLLVSINAFSQINLTYDECIKNYGSEYIKKDKVGEYYSESKKLSENETITFSFNSDNVAVFISVSGNNDISNYRFHELAKKIIPKFKLTSTGRTALFDYFFDSKKQYLIVKMFKSEEKINLSKLLFISDTRMISELIPDIEKWE